MILPGTGRGTMRGMVEGRPGQDRASPVVCDGGASTTRCASGPPPRAGEDFAC